MNQIQIDALQKTDIKNRLLRYQQSDWQVLPTDTRNSAAVLIPLVQVDNAWHVVFIRRADNPNDLHSGQVAFPGGCVESSDQDFIATALREAYEEVGLQKNDTDVVGLIAGAQSVSGFQVRSVVSFMPWPYSWRLRHEEVARVFSIPLSWLAQDCNRIPPESVGLPVRKHLIAYDLYDGERLWGLSASLIDQLLMALSLR